MKQNETFLTPVGRMVLGSLYDPETKTMDGKPMVFNSGKNTGKPRVNYFFAFAIKKNSETAWTQTEWGAKIYHAAQALYPQGEANRPNFYWKIVDGDSTAPNSNQVRPCDRAGYPGHWVLTFGGAFAPSIIDVNREYLVEPNSVVPGDYVQVNMQVNSNKSKLPQYAGIVFNCTHVALIARGEPIIFKKQIDPKTLEISSQLPAGMGVVSQSTVAAYPPVGNGSLSSAPVVPVPPPYPEILNKKMTAIAHGTYEQMKSWGWSDEQLVAHGMMTL